MKFIHAIVLAILLTFSAIASAAPASGCCPDDICDIAQCVDMGCAPAFQVIAPPTALAKVAFSPSGMLPVTVQQTMAPVFEEVWTPPD